MPPGTAHAPGPKKRPPKPAGAADLAEIRTLLEKITHQNEEILAHSRHTKRSLLYFRIASFVKVVVIIIPIALGIIYLPSILSQYYGQFQRMLSPLESGLNIDFEGVSSVLLGGS